MSNPPLPAPVCVTGASGYIAAFIVRDLLARGHHVVGTVRSLSAIEKVEPLRSLPHAAARLRLVEMDLLVAETFAPALEGCHALIHTATPVLIRTDGAPRFATEAEAEAEQIRPAVDGTRGLLHAAADAGVRRVVLTSSVAAMNRAERAATVLDESCWTDVAYARRGMLHDAVCAYAVAKTMQEQAAWDVAKQRALDLVCINPVAVVGPTLTGARLNVSQDYLVQLATGRGYAPAGRMSAAGRVPDVFCCVVDVRDVACAHVLAVETPRAAGRYLLAAAAVHAADVVRRLREASLAFARLPRLRIDSGDARPHAAELRFCNDKVRALGVHLRDWRETVADAAEALERHLDTR